MTLAEKLAQLGCVWSTQLVDGEGDGAAVLGRGGAGA